MQSWLAIFAATVLQAVTAAPDLTHSAPRHATHTEVLPSVIAAVTQGSSQAVRPENSAAGDDEQVTSAPGGSEPIAGLCKSVNPVASPTSWQATADGERGVATCTHAFRIRCGTLQAQHVRLQL
jgi:hypothetical protein